MDAKTEKMVQQIEDQAIVLDLEQDKRITVVNPNPELLYTDTLGGRHYHFPPFTPVKVKPEIANFLVQRAVDAFAMQKQQAQSERQMWADCMSSPTLRKRELAPRYAKMVGEDLVTNTTPWPRQGLVALNSEQGKAVLAQGLQHKEELESNGIDAYREKYSRWLYNRDEQKITQKEAEKSMAEMERQSEMAEEVVLEKPDADWEIDQKVGYMKKLTGEDPPARLVKDRKSLIQAMWAAYNSRKATYDKAGIKYRIE